MQFRIQENTDNINWESVMGLLQKVKMGTYTVALHEKAFKNSFAVIFIFDEDTLIGMGRALCDGAYQAALYDFAVDPDYQGKGIGKLITQQMMERCAGCNFILYAAPGKEPFYAKSKFRKMKTGMALFLDIEKMKDKGFTE